MTVGIISYRVCIPRYRIKVSEIARVWNTDAQSIADGIRMQEKSVQDMDDGTAMITVEATRNAVNILTLSPG